MDKIVNKIREKNNSIYIINAITKLTHISQNIRYKKIQKMFLNNDPLKDFNSYLDIMESLKEELKAGEVRPHYVGCENESYGYYSAVQDYCGYHNSLSGVIMEHGVNFSVSLPSKANLNETYALFFQSSYKNAIIHEKFPEKLTFCIGPYIHYATPLYDGSEISRLKEKYGKTVLIYLSHSTYNSNVIRNYTAYNEYAERYSSEYDTIMFCVYWRDVCREMYEAIKAIPKAEIVSAGFLYDPSFIRRTKSLMQLADLVVVDEIGTSVGYALYFNKRVDVIDKKDSRIIDFLDSRDIISMENQDRIKKALRSGNSEKIREVYEEFWGGRYIKTRDEIRMILEGLDEIRLKSKGKKDQFAKAVESAIIEWKNSEPSKYSLFKSALENE